MRFKRANIDIRELKRRALGDLEGILRKWIALNKKYYRLVHKPGVDCPWMLNERPSVGMLSAAAWQSGYVALEEFSTRKGRKKKKNEYAGRCDLKIYLKSNEYHFEAKQLKIKLSTQKDKGEMDENSQSQVLDTVYGRIRANHQKAIGDAKKLKTRSRNLKIRRIGLCFVVPKMKTDLSQVEIDRVMSRLIKRIESKGMGLVAWYFVDNAEDLYKHKGNNLYPGVLLILKEIGKNTHPKH